MASVVARCPDRISNLPDNVIETILMYLSTQDAVRTSILSREWRHCWAKLPQLILDDETLWNKSTVKHSARNTIAMILSQLLLLHEGPIKKFTLSISGLEICPEFDNLISFLVRNNNIEDLIIEMWTSECYRLPLSFFTCQKLRRLSLRSCLIETTPAFKGFSRLIMLKLCNVTVSAKVLGSLISSCPLLEQLVLQSIPYCNDDEIEIEIEIDAPNLKTFSFTGAGISVIFKKVLLLASVSFVSYEYIGGKYFRKRENYNLVEFLLGLPIFENLFFGYVSNKPLATGEVPARLPTTLVYLKDLDLYNTMLDELDGLSLILCLSRSSPNLKHMKIQFSIDKASSTNADLEFLKEQDYSDVTLNELKEVELKNVTGTRPQLEVNEILLSKSPSLEKMQIQTLLVPIFGKGFNLLRELTKIQLASKKAEVIYADVKGKQFFSIMYM